MSAKNGLPLLGIGTMLALAAYLDSPFSPLYEDYYYQTSEPAHIQAWKEAAPTGLVEYENKLVDEIKSNGYIIETYQEFEVRKASDGTVIERKPTSHFEKLRYKDNTFHQVP